jgi:hypothetical protein
VTPPTATLAVLTGVAVAALVLGRRLRQWHTTLPGAGERPAPVRREHVLAGVLNLAGRRLSLLPPGRHILDAPLRRACARAGVPEPEITHLLRALETRHTLLGDPTPPTVPSQAHYLDDHERLN